MTSMSKEALILKSDGAGRVQTPVARQIELVRVFERSGLSGPRFAAMAGIKYQTFATWRRKHGSGAVSRARSKEPPPRLVEAVVAAGAGSGAVAIDLPGGARLCVQHAGQVALAALFIKQLASASSC